MLNTPTDASRASSPSPQGSADPDERWESAILEGLRLGALWAEADAKALGLTVPELHEAESQARHRNLSLTEYLAQARPT